MSPIPRQLEINLFHLMKIPKLFLQQTAGTKINQKVLLLGTIGRKTGKLRLTPLQYEYFRNRYYLGAMRGKKADWIKNIQVNSTVALQFGTNNLLIGTAKILDDPSIIYSFLRLRMARNPKMIPIILKLAGVRDIHNREELLNYAKELCVVAVTIKKRIEL